MKQQTHATQAKIALHNMQIEVNNAQCKAHTVKRTLVQKLAPTACAV